MQLPTMGVWQEVCQKNASQTATTGSLVGDQSRSDLQASSPSGAMLGQKSKKWQCQGRVGQAPCFVATRVGVVLAALGMLAATVAPAPAIHEIDWRTSPLDLNLRGQNGERF